MADRTAPTSPPRSERCEVCERIRPGQLGFLAAHHALLAASEAKVKELETRDMECCQQEGSAHRHWKARAETAEASLKACHAMPNVPLGARYPSIARLYDENVRLLAIAALWVRRRADSRVVAVKVEE